MYKSIYLLTYLLTYQPPGRAAHQADYCWYRAFSVAVAQVWNGLPEAVVSSPSLKTFRRQLKSHLFQLLYPRLIFLLFDWRRYSGPCINVRYLSHSKIYVVYFTYWAYDR